MAIRLRARLTMLLVGIVCLALAAGCDLPPTGACYPSPRLCFEVDGAPDAARQFCELRSQQFQEGTVCPRTEDLLGGCAREERTELGTVESIQWYYAPPEGLEDPAWPATVEDVQQICEWSSAEFVSAD